MYSATVLEHFGNPRNVGRPEGANAEGLSGDPSAGPFMRIFLKIAGARIEQAGFETYGCVASIAAGSVLTCALQGRSVSEASGLTVGFLVDQLGGLPLGKESCAASAIAALGEALKERPGG